MIEAQFRALCRFNRVYTLALACSSLFILYAPKTPSQSVIFYGLVALHALVVFSNEFLLKVVKRLRDAELQTIEHLSIFVPSCFALYSAICVAATGHFVILLLTLFSVLQAQFLGQAKLSRTIAGVLLVFCAGLYFIGIPKAISLQPLQEDLLVIAFGVALYAYGAMVSSVMRSHSSEVGKLQSLAATDGLTQLTNRRQFNARLHEEIARARRHETPLTLALFDLDDFKRLNDFYGHQVGDRILRELGKLIRQNIRESDLPARYGGEEFALILPETREAEAYELLERIRLLIAQTVFCLPENPLTVSISIGLAQLDVRQHTAFELIELADKALYEAKRNGKNQVIRGSNLLPTMLFTKKADMSRTINRSEQRG